MPSFDPKQLTERENYKLLVGSIIPRPIAFVTTKSATGVINGAPFSYFNIVSSNPPMLSLSIQRRQGELKHTVSYILSEKEFVVHIVDEDNVKAINKTAATLPDDVSEIELAELTLIDSENIAVPGIQEARIRLECRLVEAIHLPKESPNVDLIIGEIVTYHIADDVYEDTYIIASKLKAVSRLAGQSYSTLGNQFELERPE